jgi:uncharacterized repeat protein (TIGR03803 family)
MKIGVVFFVLLCSSVQSQTFTVLHQFRGKLDGAVPLSGITLDAQGNLYGTTEGGGSKLKSGFGVIFEVAPSTKKETILLRFNGKDGHGPMAGIAFDTQGNIYGTTQIGGPNNAGVVYKVDAVTRKAVVLHGFPKHSQGPPFPVTLDQAGNVYGWSVQAEVFKIDTSNQYTVLHTGDVVTSPMILAADGNLYGTSETSLFRMDMQGNWTVLYTFGSHGDIYPHGPIAMDADGNFFGSTGATDCGIIYKIDGQGQQTTLHQFTGPDGCNPNGITMDANGVLYGLTFKGGAHNAGGIAFSLNHGQFKTLHSFKQPNGGHNPAAGLTLDTAGNLYGTAQSGGLYGKGTLFKITP